MAHITWAVRCSVWLVSCFVLSLLGVTVADDQKVKEVTADSGWYRWEGTADGWIRKQGFTNIHGYAERPDDKVVETVTVEWQQPTLDTLGNNCKVRGRLVVPTGDPPGSRPVDWLQGIAVYMGTTPGAQPEWSHGMRETDTICETDSLKASGEFSLRIDVHALAFDRTTPQAFQFGLALAQHTPVGKSSQVVTWESTAPAILSSVQMLTVPAIAKPSRELELINRASGWPFANPDGVTLVQAANALQRLGKVRALATLEQYVKLTSEEGYFESRDRNEIVFWIIHLLFEPIRTNERIPPPAIAVFLVDRESPQAANWPHDPLAIIGDVPFMVGIQIGMGGMPEPPEDRIAWARRYGVLRDQPLQPSVNPILAAHTLLESRQFQLLVEYHRRTATSAIRSQALAMAPSVLQPFPAQEHDEPLTDRQWAELVAAAQHRAIHWDNEQERFVAD